MKVESRCNACSILARLLLSSLPANKAIWIRTQSPSHGASASLRLMASLTEEAGKEMLPGLGQGRQEVNVLFLAASEAHCVLVEEVNVGNLAPVSHSAEASVQSLADNISV